LEPVINKLIFFSILGCPQQPTMGQGQTKRLTRDQRQTRDQMKHSVLQQRKVDIQQLQESMVSVGHGKEMIPVHELSVMLQIGETAKTQLDRGGNALTKSDLIAILIALDPKLRKDLVQLHGLTNSDLTAMIRSIIYDPSRILGTFQPDRPDAMISGNNKLSLT